MWVLRAVTEVGLQRREEDSAYRLRRQGRLSGRSSGRTGEYLAQGEAKYDVVTGGPQRSSLRYLYPGPKSH